MYYRHKVYVDKQKLQEIINKAGMTKSDFSRSIGHTASFIQKYLGNSKSSYETMGMSDYKLIVSMYGEEFEKKEEVKKPKVQEVKQHTVTDLTPQELSDLIYKAVFAAVKHAWENEEE